MVAQSFHKLNRDNVSIFINPEQPNWFACNEKADKLFSLYQDGASEENLFKYYQDTYQCDAFKAYTFVHDYFRKLKEADFLSFDTSVYTGRADSLKLDKLKELWIYTNNNCNLSCSHCLVNSSPKADRGLDTNTIKNWIRDGIKLGVERFYFTGGEPFIRKDIIELIQFVTLEHERELIIISNGTLIDEKVVEDLALIPSDKLKLQISLDGATEKTNDLIRCTGGFKKVLESLKHLNGLAIDKTITTVLHPHNLQEIPDMPLLAAEHGVDTIHLMWPHLRGRFAENERDWAQRISSLTELVKSTLNIARRANVHIDNYESIKWKIDGKAGVKFDLAGAGWKSLCIYTNGTVYPSAAFAGHSLLASGNLNLNSLEDIWKKSNVLEQIRKSSLMDINEIKEDPLRFFLGGGDIEHAYFYSANGYEGDFSAPDPYYPIYKYLAEEAFFDIAKVRASQNKSAKMGFDGPCIYHMMGDGAVIPVSDDDQAQVLTLHSNCVLAFDVEKPRKNVSEFYGGAAQEPKQELCCPIKFAHEDIAHIPQDVIDRFYGCGSPVQAANLKAGETHLDLGSGAGIDCFIAAKILGEQGQSIGIDMTEQMLNIAKDCSAQVTAALGFSNVEFRKGYLEDIPVENETVDVITSNCVINLSYDKKAVFSEIHRALRNGGRMVISDIIADDDVPVEMCLNPILWGECLSGALTQQTLYDYIEAAGFYGTEIMQKSFWREVQGCKFYSVTFRAYKYEKKGLSHFMGHKATYLGPFKGVSDEEGHYFPRNETLEICSDTYQKLSASAMSSNFILVAPNDIPSLTSKESCCASTSCCS